MSHLLFTWLTATMLTAPQPLNVDSFFEVQWLKEAQISPDGQFAALTVQRVDEEANSNPRSIYLYDIQKHEARQIVKENASQPAWSPDSKKLYFIAPVEGEDEDQLWVKNLDGQSDTMPISITSHCTGVNSPLVSSSGKFIALFSDIYPECGNNLSCTCKKQKEKNKSKASGLLYDNLLFRYWNHWRDERRSHLLVLDSEKGNLTDLTPGTADVPPIDLGGVQDVAFSPDDKAIAYSSNKDKVVALSTNNDIFITTPDGSQQGTIPQGKGNENSPKYSPNGKYLAYLSMARPGFEADLTRLMVYNQDTKTSVQLAAELDRPVTEYVWAPDSKGIYFVALHHGRKPLYYASLKDGVAKVVSDAMSFSSLSISQNGYLAVLGDNITNPKELFIINTQDNSIIAKSEFNKEWKEKVILPEAKESWFKGAKGEQVQIFYLPPVQPTDNQNVSLVVLVHGGPQGVFGDDFHPRWNAQMYAAKGYAVAMINFHGSVGYGQAFTDSISRNWGAAPFEDIIKGLDSVLAAHPEINKDKVCASGGSYGGYMMNWLNGHTNRFACLISHAGVYNLTSKYGSTEELWFPEWEFGGNPYDNPKLYNKWSPHNYVKQFKTPTLVIHGSKDFRVPLEQGLQMFTALQRQNVPSQLLIFPDEHHFVTKPQNIRMWWGAIHNWLETYIK